MRPAQSRVQAVFGQEFMVRTLLNHLSLVDNDQWIHSGDGGQTMGDGDYGFAFHQLVQAFLNCIFLPRSQARWCSVEQ